jgi:hypothetical protein
MEYIERRCVELADAKAAVIPIAQLKKLEVKYV